jgi:hypothetical protein
VVLVAVTRGIPEYIIATNNARSASEGPPPRTADDDWDDDWVDDWDKGQQPEVAPGLAVNAFASGLLHPRWIDVLPNGDVLVKDLPEPAVDEVVTQWNQLAAAAVLDAYYGWKLPILELAKKQKFDPTLDHWAFEDAFYRELGKESHTKVSFTTAFEFDTLVKQIDLGQPMIHWRGWSEVREAQYAEFEKQLFTDPSAELPSPRDAKEKRSWVVSTGGSDATTAMLIGYNKMRGEVLMYSPYRGNDYKCFRMRKEEMAAVGYGFFTFEPK